VTRFWLIRHGETDWNREQVFRGRADRPLSERGLRQAEALGRGMASRAVDAVVSGPLRRAVETAEPVARAHGLAVETHDGLNDLDFGAWQGLAKDVVRERYADLYARWQEAPESVVLPGGESLGDVERRAVAAIDGLVRRFPERHVAVVTHRVVLKVLVCSLLGAGLGAFWRFRFDTTSVSLLGRGGRGPVLESLNDTSHLAGVDDAARLGDF
jgi:broad specificity phosphatase PhoE